MLLLIMQAPLCHPLGKGRQLLHCRLQMAHAHHILGPLHNQNHRSRFGKITSAHHMIWGFHFTPCWGPSLGRPQPVKLLIKHLAILSSSCHQVWASDWASSFHNHLICWIWKHSPSLINRFHWLDHKTSFHYTIPITSCHQVTSQRIQPDF